MKKDKLQAKCRHMLIYSYLDGGISSCNEYNQFLCDIVPELVEHLSYKGLLVLKSQMDSLYENMIDADKI